MIKVIFRKKILQIQWRGEELEAGRIDLSREEGGEETKINAKEKTKGVRVKAMPCSVVC